MAQNRRRSLLVAALGLLPLPQCARELLVWDGWLLALLCLATPAIAQRPIPIAPPGAIEGSQVQPSYPENARRLGIQGSATLRVHVLADGQVGEVTVEQSTGNPELDQAAVDAARRWRFEPARRGDEAVAMWVRIPVKFSLERDKTDVAGLPHKAGLIVAIEGNVIAERTRLPHPVPLKTNDDIFVLDRLTTGAQSSMTTLLGRSVTLTMHERSTLTLIEVPGQSTIQFDAGKIDVAVVRESLRPGEAIDVRTPNGVLNLDGMRATVEIAGGSTKFCALDGTFSLLPRGGVLAKLVANQCIAIP